MSMSKGSLVAFCTVIVLLLLLMCLWNVQKRGPLTEHMLSIQEAICNATKPTKCAICVSREPCSYNDEVDLRILVLTYDRLNSLVKCLDALQNAEYLGDKVAMEIWIDQSKSGSVNKEVLQYARSFRFKHGPTCVHIQTKHGNVAFQWIYSWQPKPGTKEIGLFIEDDVDVSQYFYKYLKSAMKFYARNREINGFCLNDVNCRIAKGPKKGTPCTEPKDKSNMVYLYGLLCTWGYAPDPEHWRKFVNWYIDVSKNKRFDPTVKDADLMTGWYKQFKAQGKADTMLHEMYYTKYSYDNNLYTLHPNLQVLEPRPNSGLVSCRKENGLHFFGQVDNRNHGLKVWRDEFVNFPKKPLKYNWDGELL